MHNVGGFKRIKHETDLSFILVMIVEKEIYIYIYMISEHILTPFDEELGPVTRHVKEYVAGIEVACISVQRISSIFSSCT